jgi:hypothetical protein
LPETNSIGDLGRSSSIQILAGKLHKDGPSDVG